MTWPQQHRHHREPLAPSGLDVVVAAHAHHLRARQPGEPGDAGDAHGDRHVDRAEAERGDELSESSSPGIESSTSTKRITTSSTAPPT